MVENAYFERRSDQLLIGACRGFDFPPHLHSQLELLYVRSGKMTVTVREHTADLPAGSLAVIFPNQIHSYQAGREAGLVTMLICDTAYAGGYLDALTRCHPANPFLTSERLHPNVAYAMGELVQEYETAGKDSPVCGPLVQLILARVMPALSLEQNRTVDSQNLTWRIAEYIDRHYRDSLTLDSLSKALGVSRYYLSRVFSEKMGQGFSSYLAEIRLSNAKTLLKETDLTVAEVAEQSGFESQRTFYRCFRSHQGLTPLQYRKSNYYL